MNGLMHSHNNNNDYSYVNNNCYGNDNNNKDYDKNDFLIIWYLMWLWSGGSNEEILILQWWGWRQNCVIKLKKLIKSHFSKFILKWN